MDQIDLYIDGMLNESEKEEFIHHIEECEQCRSYFNETLAMIEQLRKIGEVELPPQFHQQLMQSLEKNRASTVSRTPWMRIAIGIAASILITFAGYRLVNRIGVPWISSDMGEEMKTESAEQFSMPREEMESSESSESGEQYDLKMDTYADEERTAVSEDAKESPDTSKSMAGKQMEIVVEVENILTAKEQLKDFIEENEMNILQESNEEIIVELTEKNIQAFWDFLEIIGRVEQPTEQTEVQVVKVILK